MADDHKSWKDVGVPAACVDYVKGPLCTFEFLNFLEKMLVKNVPVREPFSYSCDNCGHIYRPGKSTDNVACCVECGCYRIRGRKDVRLSKSSQNPMLSHHSVKSIFGNMGTNYVCYHQKQPRSPDIGIHDQDRFYCQFDGGEMVIESNPKISVIKAAILCPYLWDSKFDFGNGKRYLSVILSQIPV